MVLVGNEYLDQLFIWHVDDLQACGRAKPHHPFLRVGFESHEARAMRRTRSMTDAA